MVLGLLFKPPRPLVGLGVEMHCTQAHLRMNFEQRIHVNPHTAVHFSSACNFLFLLCPELRFSVLSALHDGSNDGSKTYKKFDVYEKIAKNSDTGIDDFLAP